VWSEEPLGFRHRHITPVSCHGRQFTILDDILFFSVAIGRGSVIARSQIANAKASTPVLIYIERLYIGGFVKRYSHLQRLSKVFVSTRVSVGGEKECQRRE